jgi:hypothetical protein
MGGTHRRRELWYGIGVALLACLVLPFVSLLAPGPLGMFGLGLLTPLAVLVTGVVLVISDRTRQWGIGLLVGFLVALILGAGACVAILATWDYS